MSFLVKAKFKYLLVKVKLCYAMLRLSAYTSGRFNIIKINFIKHYTG